MQLLLWVHSIKRTNLQRAASHSKDILIFFKEVSSRSMHTAFLHADLVHEGPFLCKLIGSVDALGDGSCVSIPSIFSAAYRFNCSFCMFR